MKIASADWPELLRLLDTALDIPESERHRWLARLDGVSAPIKAKLAEVLRQREDIETDDFLAALPTPMRLDNGHAGGDVLGPYRLIRLLGSGGMGTVWLGERVDAAIDRGIALKLPHGGPHQALLARRLEQERRILAALEHPHIARLYDAGVAASGAPFMALEYVDGAPIGAWCDARCLCVSDRLRLFLQVLGAVQYAHANLVLHRDLKPSNVFVNTQGEVKLLDFGTAKLMADADPRRAATSRGSALTEIGGRALTPE